MATGGGGPNIVVTLQLAAAQFQSALASVNTSLTNVQNASQNVTDALNNSFHETGRIVSGILISQAFYNSLNSIEQATGAVWEFSNTLENSSIAWTNFLGSAERAEGFISEMESFAASTPFAFEDVDAGAKKLAAFGFEAESLIPIFTTLGDAAAFMGGGAESIQRITRALGQIKAKNRVNQEELNQLTEVGIPAMEILQTKLGLTAKQMSNIGKAGITAGQALPALLEGMEERYGGMMEAMANTTEGMMNSIKDNFKFLAVDLFAPVINGIKYYIRVVRDELEGIKEAFDEFGMGGVFEHIIPDNLEGPVRQLIGLMQAIFVNSIRTFQASLPLIKAWGQGVFLALKVVLPILNAVIIGLGSLFNWMSQSPTILFFAKAIGALFVASRVAATMILLAKSIGLVILMSGLWPALMLLGKALLGVTKIVPALIRGLMTIPGAITAIVFSIVGLVAFMTGAFDPLIKGLKGYYNELKDYAKKFVDVLKPKKVEKPEGLGVDEGEEKQWEDYFENVEDGAKEAGKEVKKFLAAFDEVYEVPDKNDAGGIGDVAGFGDVPPVELGDMGSTLQDELDKLFEDIKMPELPELPKMDLAGPFKDIRKFFDDWWFFVKRHFDNPDDPTDPNNWRNRWNEWVDAVQDAMAKARGTLRLFEIPSWVITPPKLAGGWEKVRGTIKGWFDSLGNFKIPNWGMAPPSLSPNWASIKETLKNWFGEVGQLRSPSFAPISAPILSGFATAGQVIKGFFENANSYTSPQYAPINAPGIDIASTVASLDALRQVVSTVFSAEMPAKVAEGAFSMMTSWAEAHPVFTESVNSVFNNIRTVASTVFSAEMPSAVLTGVGQMVVNWAASSPGLTQGVQNVFSAIGGLAAALFSGQLPQYVTQGVSSMASRWASSHPGFMQVVKNTLDGMKNFWENHKVAIMVVIGAIIAIIVSIATFGLAPTLAAIGSFIVGAGRWFMQLGPTIMNAIRGIPAMFSGIWATIGPGITTFISNIGRWFGSLPGVIGSALRGLPSAIGRIFGDMWENVSRFFSKLINVKIPGFGNPFAGITGFAEGGIIGSDSIVRVGEGGRREAIIPLQNQSAMKPFADAVASQVAQVLGDVLGGQQSTPTLTEQQVIQVGTLIADERSLKELERRMRVVRSSESARGVR